MKIFLFFIALFLGLVLGSFMDLNSLINSKISPESIATKVIPRSETMREEGRWGVMDKYIYDQANTYGTENMFTAVADLLPGESVHPAHRHAEEEFLVITRGKGVWSVAGSQFAAHKGDLLYASPWKMHGLINTGKDTMSFFIVKWQNKGMVTPAEPQGYHVQNK